MSILSKLKLKKQIFPCLQYFTFFFFFKTMFALYVINVA